MKNSWSCWLNIYTNSSFIVLIKSFFDDNVFVCDKNYLIVYEELGFIPDVAAFSHFCGFG